MKNKYLTVAENENKDAFLGTWDIYQHFITQSSSTRIQFDNWNGEKVGKTIMGQIKTFCSYARRLYIKESVEPKGLPRIFLSLDIEELKQPETLMVVEIKQGTDKVGTVCLRLEKGINGVIAAMVFTNKNSDHIKEGNVTFLNRSE